MCSPITPKRKGCALFMEGLLRVPCPAWSCCGTGYACADTCSSPFFGASPLLEGRGEAPSQGTWYTTGVLRHSASAEQPGHEHCPCPLRTDHTAGSRRHRRSGEPGHPHQTGSLRWWAPRPPLRPTRRGVAPAGLLSCSPAGAALSCRASCKPLAFAMGVMTQRSYLLNTVDRVLVSSYAERCME